MAYDQLGRLLVIFGAVILVTGLVFLLLGRTSFGKLPGDISFSTGNVTCLVPIASMIIVSILLTIILNVVIRLFNR
jgi:hypothetical protein